MLNVKRVKSSTADESSKWTSFGKTAEGQKSQGIGVAMKKRQYKPAAVNNCSLRRYGGKMLVIVRSLLKAARDRRPASI